MKTPDIAAYRLKNQLILQPELKTPSQVVNWFGAIQSQDFAAAKWALGLRIPGTTDKNIEDAFNKGEILRTHVMRPTWHFVAPEDIRWLLALTAPRVQAYNGSMYRKSGMDKSFFKNSNAVIAKELKGGKQLTRGEMDTVLISAGIPTDKLGLSFIMMQAELEGLICSGPRQGKQFTYMLLEERVPGFKPVSRDEALAELTLRYFRSHGPAQVQDFAWWSGLTLGDARKGIEMSNNNLLSENIEDKTYWFFKPPQIKKEKNPSAFLLPGFDEYFIAYKDRDDVLEKKHSKYMNLGGGMVNGALAVNGRIAGTWKRTLTKNTVNICIKPFTELSEPEKKATDTAAGNYGRFHNLPVSLSFIIN